MLLTFFSDSPASGTSEGSVPNVNATGTVNVNTPHIHVSASTQAINSLAAAASSTGGATLAYQVAKNLPLPNTPAGAGTKVAVAVGAYLAIQGGTMGVAKALNQISGNDGSTTQNLLSHLNNIVSNNEAINLDNFPLNLLPEISKLLTAQLIFLLVILNIYFVKYLISKDIYVYLPANKFGTLMTFFLKRYISIWSQTSDYLFIFSFVFLLFCSIASKFFLSFIV